MSCTLKEMDIPGHLRTTFLPRSQTIIHGDQVFDARYLYFHPWFADIARQYDAGEVDDIHIFKRGPAEHALFICYKENQDLVRLTVEVTLTKDSYAARLAKTQRAARRWLMLRRMGNKSWIRSIRGLAAFEKWVGKLPDDVVGKIAKFSLVK